MTHNEMSPRYWARLYADFPRFQQVLLDGDEIVAEAFALPIPWDGTVPGLPAGWDAAFELGMETELEPHCALDARDQRRPGEAGRTARRAHARRLARRGA